MPVLTDLKLNIPINKRKCLQLTDLWATMYKNWSHLEMA